MNNVRKIFYALFFALVIYNSSFIARIGDSLYKSTPSVSQKMADAWNTGKSGALFYPSLAYNKFKYGSSCTFNRINGIGKNDVDVARDKSGNILEIWDGRGPLVLGSIPRNESDMALLKKNFFTSKDAPDTHINVYSLTRDFENRWAGLSKLIEGHKGDVCQYRYPTTDFTAPSFIDFLRGVRDLKNRGNNSAYVHCKAGRGRSAALVVAYLMTVLYENDKQATLQEIIDYVRLRRPQIGVEKQMKALKYFVRHLKKFGTLDAMLAEYREAIAQRDAELGEQTLRCPIE